MRFSGLRRQLLLVALAAILPTLLVVAEAARQFQRAERAAAESDLVRLSRGTAERMQRTLDLGRSVLISTVQGAADLPPSACRQMLARLNPLLAAFSTLGVVHPDGTIICEDGPAVEVARVEAPWIADALAHPGRVVVSEYEAAGRTGGASITLALAAPATGPNARIAYAVLPLDSLAVLLARSPMPPDAAMLVLNREFRVLARWPEPARFIGQTLDSARQALTRRGLRLGNLEAVGLDGVMRLYGLSTLTLDAGDSLIVSVGVPSTRPQARIGVLLWRYALGAALITLVGLAAAWWASGRLLLPRIATLTRTASRLRAGDLAARTGLAGDDTELGSIAEALDALGQALAQRSAEVDANTAELQRRGAELQRLSAYLRSVREDEQARIAREIHDQLGQTLTGLKMDVAWLERQIDAAQHPRELARVREMRAVLDDLVKLVRRIAGELRPPVLDTLGLGAALETLAAEFATRTGIRVHASIGPLPPLSDAVTTATYRIAQEALTNVARHAQASHVRLCASATEGALHLAIEDDGIGMPPGAGRGTLGLLGMRERAEQVGGRVEVERSGVAGTRVALHLPLASAARELVASR